MISRRKWFKPLIAILFILAISLSIVGYTVTTQSAKAVPLSGQLTTHLPEFSRTDMILAFLKGISHQQRVMIENAVQAQEVRSLGMDNVYLVTVPSGHVLAAVHALQELPGVKYAEPDYTQVVTATPNDPNFPMQWGYQNTGQTVNGTAGTPGADEDVTPAWDMTKGSNSIVIGETDTGVDYTHPDLAPNIWNNPQGLGGCPAGTHGLNIIKNSCDPMDDDVVYGGHGTHVAGIMGAAGNNGTGVTGVNWHVTIVPVKWVTSNGSGATSDLITALNWLLKLKQAGVNIRAVNDSTVFVGTAFSQALSDEIDLVGQNGILFVTAAGNTGDNNDTLSVRRYPCGYDRPTEICVAATDQNDNLPGWANFGPHTVDLAAAGNNVVSTLPHNNYGIIDGSSMASPQVAGAAALILSVKDMTPVQLKADILNNVDQLPSLQGKLITGGRLDICRAMPGCIPEAPPVSPTPTPTSNPGAGTFGLTSIGTNSDTMVPDRKRATQATLTVAGNVSKLTMYLAPTGTSGQQVMKGILYADQNGSPGALLGVTNAFTFVSTNAAGWYDMPFPSSIALAPGKYWIGVISGATTHVAGFRWNNVSSSRALNTNTYTSGPSNPYGSATKDSEQMSIYASYTTQGSTPTPTSTQTPTPTPTGPGQTSVTVNSDTDFNQGTFNGTVVAGTGPGAVVQLATTPAGPNNTQFKTAVTLDNTANSSTLTNYQVAVTLNTSSLVSSGEMRSDCGDIRINDADDATAITNFWIENCNNAATIVWIKVPSIPASAVKMVYLYYGNSAASSLSSLSNTFIRDIANATAAWPMNESSGSTIADTTGDGYTASASSTVGITTGKFGPARNLNGSQGFIQVANEATLPFGTSARTVCSWALTTSLSGTAVIFDTGSTNTDQFFSLGRSGANLEGFGWNDDISVPNFFSTGIWYHVCLSYDGTTATLYGNGVKLAQVAKAWNTADSGGTFIGNDLANHVWSGNIDAVSYYARALSATEISALYNGYGYATPSDKGHVLVTSYSAPPPVTSTGSNLGIHTPSGTWQSNAISLGTNVGWGDGSTGSSIAFSATVLNVSSSATIQFKVRVATSAAGLASASYVSLGTATSNAPFTLTKAQLDALGLATSSGEFIQIEAVLTNTGANTNTPQFNSCTISYKS
jgi:subtilase family protein/concanavalin A-like lectin/glucanase superfamily protein/uncharacterized protein DUF2341/fervidolysin-like protein